MKVEQLCGVLKSAAALNKRAGASDRADALQNLANLLMQHKTKTVSAYVKQTIKLANRTKQ